MLKFQQRNIYTRQVMAKGSNTILHLPRNTLIRDDDELLLNFRQS